MSIGCHPSCPQKLSFKFESNKVAISLRQSLVLHPPKVPQDSPQHDFGRFGKGLPRNSSKLVFQILFYFSVLNQDEFEIELKQNWICVNRLLAKLPPNPPKIPKTLHSTTLEVWERFVIKIIRIGQLWPLSENVKPSLTPSLNLKFQSQYVNRLSPTDAAASAKRSQCAGVPDPPAC